MDLVCLCRKVFQLRKVVGPIYSLRGAVLWLVLQLGRVCTSVGASVGTTVGTAVGSLLGAVVGFAVGASEGVNVGVSFGALVGALVGAGVPMHQTESSPRDHQS